MNSLSFFFFFGDSWVHSLLKLNNVFRKGELSSTQKEGIIICTPKGEQIKRPNKKKKKKKKKKTGANFTP